MREHSLADAPLISVVVAAYNAGDMLRRCIDSILAQSYEPIELVVVDDGSTDETAEILEAYPARRRLTVIRIANSGQSRARNIGVGEAKGDWIAFFDSDCLLHPRCLQELAAATGDDDVASVGGVQHSPEDDSVYGKAIQRYFESIGFLTEYVRKGQAAEAVETGHNPSCNVLYRRAAFEEVGGFDERLWVAEDPDLDHRVSMRGYRHLYQRRAIVYHYRSPSPAAFARKMEAYGRGQMYLIRRYGFIRKLHFVPPIALMLLVLLSLGLWLSPRATALAFALAAAGGLCFFEILRHRARLGAVFYQLLFLNASFWFAGFVKELVRPKLA